MAAAVRSAGASLPASYYGSIDGNNPVIQKFEQEVESFVGYMKKCSAPGYKKAQNEACSRGSNILFDLWNKFEPRLPKNYYYAKMLEMGDFLVQVKKYHLALWQCYGRYLQRFGSRAIEDITDVNTFKEVYFPDGLETDTASFSFQALQGRSICSYQVVVDADPKLQNTESVDRCGQILAFLRLIIQVVLPREPLCWLVYNGTVHIYSISRHLMSLGHSAKVLEYLLWASISMESSIPLLGTSYLTWRTTLYSAVCQCYYDCKASYHAETFARRGLVKISELSQLESMSSAPQSAATEAAFRQATVKMATMIFKRVVFESRRKPKGLLRPKQRSNLKDVQNLSWPRTATERLLVDMFEGSSAQFLAILEALSDSNRRILQSGLSAADNEVEILDVYAELFFAGQEIIAGGGGSSHHSPHGSAEHQVLGGLVQERPLISYATLGSDGIPLSTVVKFVKLAYSYEHWETFDALVDITLDHLRKQNIPQYKGDEQALELLLAMEPFSSNRKHRRQASHMDDDSDMDGGLPLTQGSIRSLASSDEIVYLAEVLYSYTLTPFNSKQVDKDMVVDAVSFLWTRCRNVFQKVQTGSVDSKFLLKIDNPEKWVHVLSIIHEMLNWCGVGVADPSLTAEVALRLALLLETATVTDWSAHRKAAVREKAASQATKQKDLPQDDNEERIILVTSQTHKTDSLGVVEDTSKVSVSPGRPDTEAFTQSRASLYTTSVLHQHPRQQLLMAQDVLDRAIQGVSHARTVMALPDGQSIADISWEQKLSGVHGLPDTGDESVDETAEEEKEKSLPKAIALKNQVMDLHLELIFVAHRVGLKLAALGPDPATLIPPKFQRPCTGQDVSQVRSSYAPVPKDLEQDLLKASNKSLLSKALLYVQKALFLHNKGGSKQEQYRLLEDAQAAIIKCQQEECRLYTQNALGQRSAKKESTIPPPPILLSRTDTTMIFKPAEFTSTKPVAWYRLFGCRSSGSNVRVRLNDYFLVGSGEEVPAQNGDCILTVSGLEPNERYMFAVAAYSKDGKLIGGSIGEQTKPILASHPLPILMVWALLGQVSYQVECYPIAKKACNVLWDHFVAPAPSPETSKWEMVARKDFKLTLKKLHPGVVRVASPVLLRHFLTSIFIHVDINSREGRLFCDTLCDKGPLTKGQCFRLYECERLLVALELAGYLNEAGLALQAVVQCYGLLTPLLFNKIPSQPVVQVLMRCHAVLQEIPAGLRQRRHATISDSLHHMTACITFYMGKVLRIWQERKLASNLTDAGKKILAADALAEKDGPAGKAELSALELQPEIVSTANTMPESRKRPPGKKRGAGEGKDQSGIQNEELKALEAHMLRLARQAQSDELTGQEDPNVLHAYVAALPSRQAYKEVIKFKKRARFLEFFVQVAQKAVMEGHLQNVLDWCQDSLLWLKKRNEGMVAVRGLARQVGAVTLVGDDPKKYAAAMVEYTKNLKMSKAEQVRQKKKEKRQKMKLLASRRKGPVDLAKEQQEEIENKAMEVLKHNFPEFYRVMLRRRRLRKTCADEIPWRCQMNILQGLSHFGLFLEKVELRDKLRGTASLHIYRPSFLDQEWFTFESSNTLVVGWDGGPDWQSTKDDPREMSIPDSLAQLDADRPKTGIEIAAAAAIGNLVLPSTAQQEEEEGERTPRTYRSDASLDKVDTKLVPDHHSITQQATMDALSKTFDFFMKAIVLSERGRHWSLLQNACRSLWNCAHTALLRAYNPSQAGGASQGLLSIEDWRGLVWRPFYLASDALLDMLLEIQEHRVDTEDEEIPSIVKSWVGDISMEKGGASLKFETHVDDMSLVDLRWTRRIFMRTIEILFYEEKWERLADVALRFNALTHERHAEQVSPMLITAQRKLIARVDQHGGLPPPQPHYQNAMAQVGGKIGSQLHTTLLLKTDLSNLTEIDPGGHIDPEGHNVYESGDHARRLVAVPLDVTDSLETFRQVLDKSQYTARALTNSRKLLVLYLAGQQNAPQLRTTSSKSGSRSPSRVGFRPSDSRPQLPVPQDLMDEEFQTTMEVQSPVLPRSQLGVVISSYDKTIEMLLAHNQKGLSAQAMHELANLQYHAGNVRAAYKCWSEALDIVMNMPDALHSWRKLMDTGQSLAGTLLKKCGLWGCVLGGVLAAKIAQYILSSDLGLRMECCFLSAAFFKALFRSTLPHPTADRDYALYEIGEGCEVQSLVPGVDLLSDRFRCDGRTMVASLRFVIEELNRGRHNLFVLPLLTLYQYFVTYVSRDLARAVDGRILKLRILTDLGLYSEAVVVLARLLHGDRLPHTSNSGFRQVESKMKARNNFDTSKPLSEPCNLKTLDYLCERRLTTSLANLYGPHLTCHLTLAQAHLIIALADTIHALPAKEEPILPKIGEDPFGQVPVGRRKSVLPGGTEKSFGGTTRQPPPTSKRAAPKTADELLESQSLDSSSSDEEESHRFSDNQGNITPSSIKGMLLATADQMLQTICDSILENVDPEQGSSSLVASELEVVVWSKLDVAAIQRQRQHSTLSAATVLTALKLIQDADIFVTSDNKKEKRKTSALRRSESRAQEEGEPSVTLTKPEDNRFEYQDNQSRTRLDARLWLDCRLALVKGLSGQLTGMGIIGEGEKKQMDAGSARHYCAEGLAEAEACGDVDMQAEFLLQCVLLDIQEGHPLEDVRQTLQDIINMLQGQATLSPPASLLMVQSMVQLTDLQAGKLSAAERLQMYIQAQNILLDQMMIIGDRIQYHASNPAFAVPIGPLKNIYIPHVLLLVRIKLRIAHVLIRQAAESGVLAGSDVWLPPATVLTTTLGLCRAAADRQPHLEAEILLQHGMVQRQLSLTGKYPSRGAAATLLEAITTSHASNHDLGLMRQAYLEIALSFLLTSGALSRVTATQSTEVTPQPSQEAVSPTKSVTEGDLPESPSPRQKAKRAAAVKAKTRERARVLGKIGAATRNKEEREQDREKRAAWLAIRCASAIADVQRASMTLAGNPQVTTLAVKQKAWAEMPEYALLDMVSSHLSVGKMLMGSNLASQLSDVDKDADELARDVISRTRAAARQLSWVHMLGYASLLQSLATTANTGASTAEGDTQEDKSDQLSELSGMDLESTYGSVSSTRDQARSPLFNSGLVLRLTQMHRYLMTHLPMYASDCVALNPPKDLALPLAEPTPDVSLISVSYVDNLLTGPDTKTAEDPSQALSREASHTRVVEKEDLALLAPNKEELSLQWYQPGLDVHGPEDKQKVLLMYAANTQPIKATPSTNTVDDILPEGMEDYILPKGLLTGQIRVPLGQLLDLHRNLAIQSQLADMSLGETPTPRPEGGSRNTTPVPDKAKGGKKTRIKPLSAKVASRRDEQLEVLLKQSVTDAHSLITLQADQEPVTEAPFSVTLENINHLEKLFNPGFGCTVKNPELSGWLLSKVP
ncbi:cilia- and flagella-associated protein 54-like isoform X2 [Branchiostoma floridae x Branchiostoma belcheri]